MVLLNKSNFNLFEIEKEYQEGFSCATGTLSDFHVNALIWIAEALKQDSKDTVIWCDNNAWWDDKENRFSVFSTSNGTAMLKDWTKEKLYRIEFNNLNK